MVENEGKPWRRREFKKNGIIILSNLIDGRYAIEVTKKGYVSQEIAFRPKIYDGDTLNVTMYKRHKIY
jgi:hypothetical protein